MGTTIYLDYAATTPVDPRVAKKMCAYLGPTGGFGNPASRAHRFGTEAAYAVETARARVAAVIGADSSEIIWTSGATESNNLAIAGAARSAGGGHIVTTGIEHPSVLDVCRQLETVGFEVTYVAPETDGRVPPSRIEAAIRRDTFLASVMHANNETGVLQDLGPIGRITRAHGVLLHVDAAQSAGKVPIDVDSLRVDLMSLSAHKICGPKGVGALYLRHRPPVTIAPLCFGGGHERGLRPGTLATHQIAGMGEAFAIADDAMAAESARVAALRERLWCGLEACGGVLNGALQPALPGILNVSFDSVQAEDLIHGLHGVALATGSACSSARQAPSHVLQAMGLCVERCAGAIRFSAGRFTTAEEIDQVIVAVGDALAAIQPGH